MSRQVPPLVRRTGLAAGIVVIALLLACRPSDDLPTPVQPIAYNHSVHVSRGQACTYCHRGAKEAVKAGMPALETCATCHRWVIPDHPEIQKVLQAWSDKQPIPWQKLNFFAATAMVHFNHRAHARAKIECVSCHGDIASMTVAQPIRNTANMAWCLDCHRDRNAPTDCLTCHY